MIGDPWNYEFQFVRRTETIARNVGIRKEQRNKRISHFCFLAVKSRDERLQRDRSLDRFEPDRASPGAEAALRVHARSSQRRSRGEENRERKPLGRETIGWQSRVDTMIIFTTL